MIATMPSRSSNQGAIACALPAPGPKPLSMTNLNPHGMETVAAAATASAMIATRMCPGYLVAKLHTILRLRIDRPFGLAMLMAMPLPNSAAPPPQMGFGYGYFGASRNSCFKWGRG